MTFENIIFTITAILALLIILKTYLFFSATSNRRFENWFFFSHYALYNSRSEKSRKMKQLQNRLTWIALGVATIDVALILFLYPTVPH